MSAENPQTRVDYDQLRACLTQLARSHEEFLKRAVLIGGGACWFYRALLEAADDADFRVPEYSADDESKWLSKDLDFTGLIGHEAEELMPQRVIKDDSGRSYLSIEGVRLGFAQMCFWLDSDTAKQNCRHARIEGTDQEPVDFFVADPVSLYREKQYATERRNAPGDPVHFALLREFVAWDTVGHAAAFLADPSLEKERKCQAFLSQVRSLASEIFADDRVERRMVELLDRHREGTPAQKHAVAFLEKLLG